MSTPDYTTQATTLIAATAAKPWVNDPPRDDFDQIAPGFDFWFADLNMEIGVPGATEADARADAGLIAAVARSLQEKAGG